MGTILFLELIDIIKQKGELEFCKALNNISEGCMDAQDVSLIKSREIAENNSLLSNATYLFATNKKCQDHNADV